MHRTFRSAAAAAIFAFALSSTGCVAALGDFSVGTQDAAPGDGTDATTSDTGAPDATTSDGALGVDANPDGNPGVDGGPDAATCGAGEQLCNGSCVSTSDVHACGSCTNDCTKLANVDTSKVSCSGGQCVLACVAGFAHCSADPSTGCETDVTSGAHCGDCTTSCAAPTPLCEQGDGGVASCVSNCTAPTPDLCGTKCTDKTKDLANCGTCGNACATPLNGAPTCNASRCGFTCNGGFHACNGTTCADNTSPASCGTSCSPCPTLPNSTPTCDATSGKCGFSCKAPFMDCDGDPTNGCEADTSSDAAHCGSCQGCPAIKNGTPGCTNSRCVISSCAAGYTPCTGGGTLTCADLKGDPFNCTTCGNACVVPPNGFATCNSGCVANCNPNYHLCGGNTCADNNSTASCGSSCSPCSVPTNGIATCNGTSCGMSCNNAQYPNYCATTNACVNLSNDPSNCGSCGGACAAPKTACAGGGCACPAGTPNYCPGPNTCADFQSDPANCGYCGHDCGGGQCTGGVCQPVQIAQPPTYVVSGSTFLAQGYGIAVDPNNIYWAYSEGSSNGGSIWRAPINTKPCAPNCGGPIVSNVTSPGTVAMAPGTGGPDIYYATQGDVWFFSVGTSALTHVATGMNSGYNSALVTDPSFAYFMGPQPANGVAKCADNTSCFSPAPAPTGVVTTGLAVYLAVDGANTYYTDYGAHVYKCALSGCGNSPTAVVTSGTHTEWVYMDPSIDPTSIWWTDRGTVLNPPGCNGRVMRSDKRVVDLTITTYSTSACYMHGLLIDANNVYWGDSGSTQIFACPINGCPASGPNLIANHSIQALAQDAKFLYWTEYGNGVWKVAKP